MKKKQTLFDHYFDSWSCSGNKVRAEGYITQHVHRLKEKKASQSYHVSRKQPADKTNKEEPQQWVL